MHFNFWKPKKLLSKMHFNFWKPTKGYNSKSYGPLAAIPVYTIHPVTIHFIWPFSFLAFIVQEKSENFQEWQNLKIYEGT